MNVDTSTEKKEKVTVTLDDVDFDNPTIKSQLTKVIAEILSWPDKD